MISNFRQLVNISSGTLEGCGLVGFGLLLLALREPSTFHKKVMGLLSQRAQNGKGNNSGGSN